MSATLRNWAGNVTFAARAIHRPSTVDELRKLVAGSRRIRALGTAHSFSTIADTRHDLVSLAGLPGTVHIDPETATATVPAGLRYGELAEHLHAHGWAVPNLGSLPHIGVAGACSTSTHGSGVSNGSLATAVVGMRFVTATGDLVSVDRTDADFAGMVVGLGAFGVLTDLTLRLVPTFQVRQTVFESVPLSAITKIMPLWYSVSAFTNWRGADVNQVWVKHRVGDDAPQWTAGGRPAAEPRHPLEGAPAGNCTEQLGVPGPWHERLPHFKLGFTPSSGDELQSEYLLPLQCADDALRAVDAVRDRIAPAVQACEIRTIAADDLWMSPMYGRATAAIHCTWHPRPDEVDAATLVLEDALAPFEPRPHWGKLCRLAPETVAARYPRYDDFRRLLARWDPDGVFRNDWLDFWFPPVV